jgi:hypothetical protein
MADTAPNAYPNVRSGRYFIVESRIRCDQCNVVTAVFGFALPEDYETVYIDDDAPDDDSGTWESPGFAAVLFYVEYLPEAVANRIRSVTQHYRLDAQSEASGAFWMNHCEHCGAPMEEEELHGEPWSPFGSMPEEGLEAIRLHEVREPFEATAGGQSHDVKPMDS